MCEQLLLSDCTVHLIIVYSDTKTATVFFCTAAPDCRSHDHNPETLHFISDNPTPAP